MKIGYARVSTDEQNLNLQLDALRLAGCGLVFEDRGISGVARDRPGLEKALSSLKRGDTLVVWKLDRLGRSLADLIERIRQLGTCECGFQAITEGMDTGTAAGRLLFHVVGALSEFERTLIVERTKAGLIAARNRGQALGRKPVLSAQQVKQARALLEDGESATSVAASFKVGRSTMYRALGLSHAT